MILQCFIHISYQTPLKPREGPIAVILALTEEIAEQIQQLANDISTDTNMKCTILCNDINNSGSHSEPSNNVGELLITTPYHLYEILRTKSLSLQRCSQFAVYEADKMIDMCLDDVILQIDSQIRPECQRLIWSSSWTNELNKLITDDYVRLDIGCSSSVLKQSLSENRKQIVKVSEEKQKEDVLHEIIDLIVLEKGTQRTLIFTETPDKADKIANILQRKGYQSESFHNRKSAVQRDTILSEFQNEKFQFLVLTDVAAKNIKFNEITNVLNFDMPFCISDYINRVSRSNGSSNGGMGTSYSIVTEEDGDLVDDLIAILQQSQQPVNPALFILKAANVDSDDEITFAVPKGKGFQKYTIDNNEN